MREGRGEKWERRNEDEVMEQLVRGRVTGRGRKTDGEKEGRTAGGKERTIDGWKDG